MTPPDETDRELDLFLDGDLTGEEMEAFRRAIEEDPALRASIRDDLVISAALETAGTAAFPTSDEGVIPVGAGPVRTVSQEPPQLHRIPAWRRWPSMAAAAAALLLAFFVGRSMGDGSGSESERSSSTLPIARVVVATAGDRLATDAVMTRDVLVGDSGVRVRPGCVARVVSTRPASLLLETGSVEVTAARGGEVSVEIDGFGTAVIDGTSQLLLAPATNRRDAYLMVTSFSGATRVVDGEFTDRVEVGEPRLFDGGGPRLTGDVLARLAEIEGDEGMMVLTTAEHTELLSSLDDDKERLQVKVAELMEERERLAVELDALKRRAPDQDLTLEELIRSTAELAEKEGLDGRDRARWWRRIRAVRRKAGHKTGDIVAVIDRELLSDKSSPTRHRLGLWFLSQMRSRAATVAMRRFVRHDAVHLRMAAVEGLARQKDKRLKSLLHEVYRDDKSIAVRIAAAGGLVLLGDHGQPLQWLVQQYTRRPRHPEGLRRRIFARVLAAPLSASKASQYIVDLCLREDAPLNEQRDVVLLLARLGSQDAEKTLAFLAESAARRQIRVLARRRLNDIEGR